MPIQEIVAKLEQRYPDLERVGDKVFRGTDLYEGRPYAIRYFDLRDDLLVTAGHLHDYQNRLLGASYFDSKAKPDLRWNHYLYFVTSSPGFDHPHLLAKTAVESDREYARKLVITETELDRILADPTFAAEPSSGLPPDALSLWTEALEKHDLEFIVDDTLKVPAIIRSIVEGERRPVLRPPVVPELDPAERSASSDFLASIDIREFRKYPLKKHFDFGAVNLVLGVNGVGKTSLFEAIEYLFCGKTLRAGSVLAHTSIAGRLATSGLTLRTSTATSQAALRSRHLIWYGKSEVRTLTLDDSFSKFNFLDTDAAVRLSVEKSQERIVEDISQLLLGAEASKVLDRFQRVSGQLDDSRRKLETDITLRDARRSQSAEKLRLLRDTPRESGPLFSDLLRILQSTGWRRLPDDKNQAEQLGALIQSALVSVAVLKSTDVLTPNTTSVTELNAAIKGLIEAETALNRLLRENAARRRDDANAKVRLQQLEKRTAALDGLSPVVAAGAIGLHRKREALEQQLSDQTSSLAAAEAGIASAPSLVSRRRQMVARAVAESTETVRAASDRIDAAKTALATFESAQSLLSSLRQRLRSNAQEIIGHTGDRTHCPLCAAQYTESELKRILDQGVAGVVTAESDRLRSELNDAESAHQARVSELTALRTLQSYIRTGPAKTSVEAAISFVISERVRLAALSSELDGVRSALQAHEEKGWTSERLMELASNAGLDESEISGAGIANVREATIGEQKQLVETISRLAAEAEAERLRLTEIASTYSLGTTNATELAQAVSERKRLCEDRRAAIAALEDHITPTTLGSTSELEAQLREAQGLAVKLRAALAQEQQHSEAIQRESKLMDDAVAEIQGLRVQLRRVDSARAVLEDLVSRQSGQVLTATVLQENAAKIASTFAKIHAPNEFDLVANGGLRIVRRGGASVGLDEMSSGQRSAYAISLFLAMNERLSLGPRVVLFDDPVAHVDDINTLSLLDHLRDIALTGRRQIFFATADSKIGALFGRKFRFLGERFKEIELTRE